MYNHCLKYQPTVFRSCLRLKLFKYLNCLVRFHYRGRSCRTACRLVSIVPGNPVEAVVKLVRGGGGSAFTVRSLSPRIPPFTTPLAGSFVLIPSGSTVMFPLFARLVEKWFDLFLFPVRIPPNLGTGTYLDRSPAHKFLTLQSVEIGSTGITLVS